MSYAFELHFDEETEIAVRRIWDTMMLLGYETSRNGVAPHVTLAIAAEYDADALERRLRRFAAEHPPFEVTFNGIESFGAAVQFLSPEPSERLRAVHHDFHARFPSLPAAVNSHFYAPSQWVPHCTIATRTPGHLSDADVTFEHPVGCLFTRLRVVEYPALKLHFECPLGGAGKVS